MVYAFATQRFCGKASCAIRVGPRPSRCPCFTSFRSFQEHQSGNIFYRSFGANVKEGQNPWRTRDDNALAWSRIGNSAHCWGQTSFLQPTTGHRLFSTTYQDKVDGESQNVENTKSFLEDPAATTVGRGDIQSGDSDLVELMQQETAHLLRVLGAEEGEQVSSLLSQTKFEEFDRVMEAWSKHAAETTELNGMEAAGQAEALLIALEQNVDSDRETGQDLIPDAVSYNKVLHAYAVSRGGREAAERAESILERMLTRCRDYCAEGSHRSAKVKPPEPTVRSFNIAINSWAKSGEQDSGRRAEGIFTKMEEWERECQERYQSIYVGDAPNARSLSGVVDAWAQSQSKEAAERVMIILEHALEKRRQFVLAEKGSSLAVEGTAIKPTVVVFNSTIHAWVNSGQGRYGAEKAEEVLLMLERWNESKELGEDDASDEDDIGLNPNTRTLSLILDAWAQCEDSSGAAAARAQDTLDRMEKLYHEGHDVKPNYVSFTTCIKAWSRSRDVADAAERAEAILLRLLHLYETTGDENLKPTSLSGNAVITAWARSRHPNSARRAEAVLEKLGTFTQPDCYSYNSVIDAYAKKGDAPSAKRVLERMELTYKDKREGIRPDTITYNSVLNAFAKSRSEQGVTAAKAEALLRRMEAIYRSGRTDVQPNLRSYTSVIDCWARSNHPWQGSKAYRVLQRMVDQYKSGNEKAMPDVFAYTRVLHACATTNWKQEQQRQDALTTALRVFEELQQSPQFGEPQSRTYSTMMMACSRLSSNYTERGRLCDAVFKQCCAAGQVSRAILELAHRTIPQSTGGNLLGPSGSPVPSAWYRNVQEP